MARGSSGKRGTTELSEARGSALLRTKLVLPPLRDKRVGRGRLIEKLNGGLDRALILVSAPAGYGKTTLVSGWLHEIPLAGAWLSLEDEDNEPMRFLQYLVAAIGNIVPSIPPDSAQMCQGGSAGSIQALLTLLINAISVQSKSLVLALDDLHLIHAQPVLDALAFLIDHIPPELHLVLLSRSDPIIPLARMRARNQVLDVRAQDLRFDPPEVAAFLEEVMELKLAPADLAVVEARTEGWIAGLQLAALSMKASGDTHSFLRQFADTQDYLVDYLVQEVLESQPPEVSTFLLQTSGLGRMCGALCDAVVEPLGAAQTSGEVMLQGLERLNLFIAPLDEERRWYRYHRLFGDVIHKRLRHVHPELAGRIEARAAAWYEANGWVPEAIHHFIAAGDRGNAIRLIEEHGCTLLIRGEVLTLGRWLDAVKDSAQGHPWFPIYRGWIAALTGDVRRVEEFLGEADQLIAAQPTAEETGTMRGALLAARAHNANLHGQAAMAAEYARQALAQLTADDDTACSLRVVAISLLGDASTITGDLDTAWDAYSEAAGVMRGIGDVHLSIVLNSNLGNVLAEKGQLRQAAAIHRETLEMAALPGGGTAAIGGRAFIELGQICYEWNELAEAAEHVERGLALCRQWGNREQEAVGVTVQAYLKATGGEQEDARVCMQDAVDLAARYRLAPSLLAWVRARAAQMWLAQGELDKVEDLIAASGIAAADEISHVHELEFIMLIRLSLAQADFSAARQRAERLLPPLEAGRRNGRLIGVLLLHALALRGLSDVDAALASLGRALSLARPEGYVRTFIDEGEPLARLLYLARARGVESAYTGRLLAVSRLERGSSEHPAQLLSDPLTAREIEILRMIAGGCSNRDIASQLYISSATVKRHISNIYTKLNVESRVQALARSSELGLLG
jgi:LuxR family maltose regulon positive regulatory protein